MKLTSWLRSLKNGLIRSTRGHASKRRELPAVNRGVAIESELLEQRVVLHATRYSTFDPDGIYDATSLQQPPNNPSIPYSVITIRVRFQNAVTIDISGGRPSIFFNTASTDPNAPNYPGIVGSATYLGPSVTNAAYLDFTYDVQNGQNTPGPLQPFPELTVIGGTNGGATITDGGGSVNMNIIPSVGASINGQIVDEVSGLDKFIFIDTLPIIINNGPANPAVDSTSADSTPYNLDPSQGPIVRPYRVGDPPIDVTVSFTEPVSVTGTPIIWLETNQVAGLQTSASGQNPADARAVYVSGSGTNKLHFQYIVQGSPGAGVNGDNTLDLDYTGSTALQLPTANDLIKDQDFQQQDGLLNLPLVSTQTGLLRGYLAINQNIQVDTRSPAVALTPGVTAVNANGTYGVGQVITIRVTFDEAVFLTGSPTLTLATGAVNRVATFGGFDGSDTLLFNYVVQKGDIALDLDYVSPTSLNLNGGSLIDVAGNNANITLPAPGQPGSLSYNRDIVIDTNATVTNVTSPVNNGNYGIGQVIPIQVVFNKPVTVFGNPQLILDLDLPTDSVVVDYAFGSGTNILTFNYTIQAGHNTSDLDYVNSNSLQLNGGSIIDSTSNGVVDLTLPLPGSQGSLGFNKNIKIDTTLPTLGSVTASASVPDGTYVVGQIIPIQVKFSEPVTVTGVPQITIDTNGLAGVQPFLLAGQTADAVVNYSSGSGTNTLTFNYTVASGQTSLDLDALLLSLVNGSRIRDLAGNDIAPTGTILNLPSLNTEIITNTVAINNVSAVAQVTNVNVGNVTAGQTFSFRINGGPAVSYTATAQDTQQTVATALRGLLAGNATVTASGFNNIVTLTANNAGTAFTVTILTGNLTTTPVKTNVVPVAQRTDVNIVSVAPGDVFTITVNGVTFTYVADASDTPTTVANTGSGGKISLKNQINAHGTVGLAVTATGSGSSFSVTANTPGTPFSLSTGLSLAGNRNLVIDTAPIITNVTSTDGNGVYNEGQTITIQLQFNEPVVVTGTPTLQLETGTTDGVALYNSGSGTNVLTFLYTIGPGETSVDLDYLSATALTLNGGTIVDADGQPATAILTLPAPGAAGSLGFNKDILIDSNSNDAPVNLVPGTQTTTEDVFGGLVFSTANGNLIQVRDVDAGNNIVEVVLTATGGTVTLPNETGLTVTGNGTAQVTIDGDLATINARLDGLVFAPSANVNSSTTAGIKLNIFSSDLGWGLPGNTQDAVALTDSDNVLINVTAVNDAPVAASFTVSTGVNLPLNGIILQGSDVDVGSSLAYTIVTPPSHGTLVQVGGVVNYTPANGYVGPDFFTYRANDGSIDSNLATVTINVVPVLNFGGFPDVSIQEGNVGNLNAVFTVTLSNPAASTVSIDYAVVAGTATAGVDYLNIPGTITFAVGEQTKTILVPVVGDLNDEPNETFFVVLSNPSGVVLADTSAQGTILNDDGVSINDVTAVEGNSGTTAFNFTVSLSVPAATTVTVQYATANGTADNNTDYNSISGSLSFLPGEQSKTVTVLVNGDSFNEQNETFFVNLSNANGVSLAKSQGIGTIVNDDATPTMSISDVSLDEGNSGVINFTFVVSLSTVSGQVVTVDYATADSSATAASDYLAQTGTLTFQPGVTSQTVTISVLGDQLLESDEFFFVNLSNAFGAALADSQGTGLIRNDDGLKIIDATIIEGDTGTKNLVFTVTAPQSGGATITVDYSTASGTAVSGVDFTPVSGTLTFPPGTLSRTITVPIIGDYFDESDETFFVNLSNAVNAPILDDQAVGTIQDNDVTPGISINDVSLSEGASGTKNMTFTLTLSDPIGLPVTVQYATFDQTAVGGADYVPTSGTITFQPFNTTQTITVPILGDLLDEANETFLVVLTNATNATIVTSQGVGTILDDDATPTLSINDISLNEGQAGTTTATFTVNLSAPSGQTVTVNYSTADGSAIAGSDYVAQAGTLTFLPGVTSQTITVAVNGDTLYELDENFVINLSSPVNATLASSGQQGVATLANDDPKPTIVISDASVVEGNAGTVAMTFTVTLLQVSSLPATVNFSTSSGSALDGNDYQTAVGTLTFAPGETSKTITVLVNGDTSVEDDENFFVNLSGATNAVIGDSLGVGTITNDDVTPSISVNDVSVLEGNSGVTNLTFTVTITNPNGLPISVQFSTSNGTAQAGTDYVAQSGTLTFAPNQTSRTITVVVNGDLNAEGNEQFFLNLSNPSNAVISDLQGVGTILNDDNNPPVVTVPVGPYIATEDTDVALTGISVTDVDAAGAGIQVTLTAAHGTLTVQGDVAGGVISGQIQGNGTGSVTLSGTITEINNTLAAANAVIYRGVADFAGADVLTVIANDLGNTGSGGSKLDTKAVQILVSNVNDAPTVLLPGPATTSVRGNAVAVDNLATFVDPDNQANYNNATITATNVGPFIGAKDEVSIRNQGKGAGEIGYKKGRIYYGGVQIGTAAGGKANIPLSITLNSNATRQAVEALLRNITFGTAKRKLTTLPRTITFVMTDGQGGTSDTASKEVQVSL